MALTMMDGGQSRLWTGEKGKLELTPTAPFANHPVFGPLGKIAYVAGSPVQRVYVDGKPISPPGFMASAPVFCDTPQGLLVIYTVGVGAGRRRHRDRHERRRHAPAHPARGREHVRGVQPGRAPRVLLLHRQAGPGRGAVPDAHPATVAREEDLERGRRRPALGAHRHPVKPERMSLRLERSADLGPALRVEPSPALLFPIDTSIVVVNAGDGAPQTVDRAAFVLVPAGLPYRVRAKTTVTSMATLLVGRGARDAAVAEYRPHIEGARFDRILASPRLLPRTRWLDEIVHRYVFERDVCGKHGSAAAVFLETEIAKEVYFLCAERDARQGRASVVREEDDLVARARAWIDDHLFEPLRVGDLARRAGTSESTLLRAFRRQMGKAPAAYARERRLDAALLLLQSGRLSVGEVAARVGYAGLAAFTAAFTRRFERAPSSVRRADGEIRNVAAAWPAAPAGSRAETETRKPLTGARKPPRPPGARPVCMRSRGAAIAASLLGAPGVLGAFGLLACGACGACGGGSDGSRSHGSTWGPPDAGAADDATSASPESGTSPIADATTPGDAASQADAGSLVPPFLGGNVEPGGVVFRVWAPDATSAVVQGDFAAGSAPMTSIAGRRLRGARPRRRGGRHLLVPAHGARRTGHPSRSLLPRARRRAACRVVDPGAYAWTTPAVRAARA